MLKIRHRKKTSRFLIFVRSAVRERDILCWCNCDVIRLLACCVVIKERRVSGASTLSAWLKHNQRRRIVGDGNEIRGLLVHVVHLLLTHLLLLLKQKQVMVMMVNWRWRVMRRVNSVVKLIALKVVERQSLSLVVIVDAVVVVRHLLQLWLSVVVVSVVVVVRVVFNHNLRRWTRLTIWWNHCEHWNLTRRVWLILLVLMSNWVFDLTHRKCTVRRCTICNCRFGFKFEFNTKI